MIYFKYNKTKTFLSNDFTQFHRDRFTCLYIAMKLAKNTYSKNAKPPGKGNMMELPYTIIFCYITAIATLEVNISAKLKLCIYNGMLSTLRIE